MAGGFDLTSRVSFEAVNPRGFVDKMRKALSIEAPIKLVFDSNARSAIKGVSRDLSKFDRELTKVLNTSRKTTVSLKSLAAAFANFKVNSQFSAADKELQSLYRTARATNAQIKQLKSGGAIKISTSGTKGGLIDTAQIAKGEKAVERLAASTTKARTAVEEFGRISGLALRRNAGFIIATGAVFGFTRAITEGFSAAIKFQTQVVKIAQVANTSVKAVSGLTDEITRLSVGLGTSSEDLVAVSLTLKQAGLSIGETKSALDALAKTSLAATFGDITDTTEGAIAIMKQFGISAGDLSKALGSANAVAADFAVESDDIISAVKRAGGVFAALSKSVESPLESFNQFISVFTSVRATTRESADTIATGLRTIFSRLQRPETIKFLRELGVELTDLQGRFVGPFKAITELSTALDGIDVRSPVFARVVEQLSARSGQAAKIIPLLTESRTRLLALKSAQEGQTSLDRDAAIAQEALSNRIQKTIENFRALIREVAGTDTFQTLVKGTLQLTDALIELARAVKPIIPLIGALALLKGASVGAQFLSGFSKLGITGGAKGFAAGGPVRGPGGIDTIPARLTAGEYVLNKDAVKKIGVNTLDSVNKLGRTKSRGAASVRSPYMIGFAKGGFVSKPNFIGSGVETPRIEIVLNVRDIRGNVTSSINTAGSTGADVVSQITGNNQSNLSETPEQRRARIGVGGSKKLTQGQIRRIRDGVGAGPQLSLPLNAAESANERQIRELRRKQQAAFLDFAPSQQLSPSQIRTRNVLELARSQGSSSLSNLSPLALRQKQLEIFAGLPKTARIPSNPAATGRPPSNFNQIVNNQLGTSFGNFRALPQRNLSALTAEGLRQEQIDNLGPNFSSVGSNGRTNNFKSSLLRFGQRRFNSVAGTVGRIGGGLSSASGSFSRSLPGRVLGSGGVAIGASIAGSLIGDRVGGKAGSTISGAAAGLGAGALAGSVIPGIGTATGAAIGAIVGGFNAFVNANFDEKIQKITDSLSSSLKKAGDGFANFERDVRNVGFDQAFTNLGRSTEGVGNSIRGKLASDIDTSLTTGFDGFGKRRFNARKTAFSLQDEESRDTFIRAGQDLKENSAPQIAAVENLFQTLVDRGSTGSQAFDKLTSDQKILFGLGRANTNQLGEIGKQAAFGRPEDLESFISGTVAGSGILDREDERIEKEREIARIMDETNNRLAENANQVDLFSERLANLAAVFQRAGDAAIPFQRRNEALTSRRSGGAGIRSQQLNNVFNNTRGFTTNEIKSAVGTINSQFGGNAAVKEFTSGLLGAKQLEANLPRVLNQLNNRTTGIGGENLNSILGSTIESEFGSLPKPLRDVLTDKISATFSDRNASPGRLGSLLAGGETGQFSDQIVQQLNNVGAQLIDTINKNIADYEQVLNEFVGLNREANQSLDTFNQLQLDNALSVKRLLGDFLSVGDRTAGANTQITSNARRAGIGGAFTVSDVIDRENFLNTRANGNFSGNPADIATEMANLTIQQQAAVDTLRSIADNTSRQAALQEDLNSIIDSRGQARQALENFVSADPGEQAKILRQVNLARQEAAGIGILRSQRADAAAGRPLLNSFVGATEGPEGLNRLDNQFLNALGRNPDTQRLIGAAGVNLGANIPDFFRNRDAGFQDRLEQFRQAGAERERAQGALAQIDRRDANQFLQNGQDAFNATQNALFNPGALLDRLNATLGSLPSEIAIGGQIRVDLNVNGAEVLGAMGPVIQQMIADKVRQQIAAVIPMDGPSGRRLPSPTRN